MNIAQFVFFDSSSTNPISNTYGNIGSGGSLTLQVIAAEGTPIDLQVEGLVDMNSPDKYAPIRVVSLDTFKTTNTITEAGIYMIIISGVNNVRLTSNAGVGNFKAYAVSVN